MYKVLFKNNNHTLYEQINFNDLPEDVKQRIRKCAFNTREIMKQIVIILGNDNSETTETESYEEPNCIVEKYVTPLCWQLHHEDNEQCRICERDFALTVLKSMTTNDINNEKYNALLKQDLPRASIYLPYITFNNDFTKFYGLRYIIYTIEYDAETYEYLRSIKNMRS